MEMWRALCYAVRMRWIGRDEADRLVCGGLPGPGQRGLGALLSAAAAPPTAGELAAEPAAVAAFRRVRRSHAEGRREDPPPLVRNRNRMMQDQKPEVPFGVPRPVGPSQPTRALHH
jgi:hypothetical protein